MTAKNELRREMIKAIDNSGLQKKVIAKRMGVHPSFISKIVNIRENINTSIDYRRKVGYGCR